MKTRTLIVIIGLAATTAFSKEPVSTAPTPVQAAPTSSSNWELSAGALWHEMNMQWDTKGLPGIGASALNQKESKNVVAPSVVLSRKIAQIKNTQLLLSLGWSYANASWDSGEFEAGEGPDELYTSDISHFEVSVNRFMLALDARQDFGGGWSGGLALGPTLTLVNGDFRGTRETFRETPDASFGNFEFGSGVSASGTEAAFGVMGAGYLRYTFSGDRVFLQATGGYNWSEEVRFGSSQIGAKFDASTWTAGVSLGFKF